MFIPTLFFSLLRYELTGDDVAGEMLSHTPISTDTRRRLDMLAKQQDLSHLTADALLKSGAVTEEDQQICLQQQAVAMWRWETAEYDIGGLSACLEEAAIPYVLLKGAVLCHWYPEPWMRTASDVDILVRSADFSNAVACLCRRAGYQKKSDTPHDTLLLTPTGTRVEVHHTLIEQGRLPQADILLREEAVWDHTVATGSGCRREMTTEMLYFYHIAHMAKHVLNGGIGVRFFIDLWLLEKYLPSACTEYSPLIRQSGLEAFARYSRQLAEKWFGSLPHTDRQSVLDSSNASPADTGPDDRTIAAYEDLVLHAGLYGSVTGIAGMHLAHKGSRSYWSYRLFPPRQYLTAAYPRLREKPWLAPAITVHRLLIAPFRGGWRRIHRERSALKQINHKQQGELSALLDSLELGQ